MTTTRKLLDLSTAHLTEEMRIELNCLYLREGNLADDALHGVVLHPTEHGGLMYVPENPEDFARDQEDGVDGVLLSIQQHARRHGCDYVLFDADAPIDDALETFDE